MCLRDGARKGADVVPMRVFELARKWAKQGLRPASPP
jgi:hypothetical protein